MSLRLTAVDLWLRAFEKPFLARVREPRKARRRLEAGARTLFRPPRDMREREQRVGALRLAHVWTHEARPERTVLYLHGGAFVMGSADTHKALACALGRGAGAGAALPDYRLVPEHPFPAALDDALTAYRALLGEGAAPHRLALAGDSAGGGLVFSLLLALRRAGLPDPAALVAFSPWTDMTMSGASLQRNAKADAMLPVGRMGEVIGWRVGDRDPADPLISPAFARFDRPPPPTLIQIGEREILADDARMMAEALRAGGGEVRLENTGPAPHAFQLLHDWLPEAREAVARAGAFLADRFAAAEADVRRSA